MGKSVSASAVAAKPQWTSEMSAAPGISWGGNSGSGVAGNVSSNAGVGLDLSAIHTVEQSCEVANVLEHAAEENQTLTNMTNGDIS
eukprot:766674-Hanusia_phi.AAC.4